VVGPDKLNRPCRIYAPVGTHKTLLAYLVRRLLENGANTSFVNRIADPSVPVNELIAEPADIARAIRPLGAPHPSIALPRDLFAGERVNSAGIDLSSERRLAFLAAVLRARAETPYEARPIPEDGGPMRPVLNPADRRDVVGHVVEAGPAEIEAALAQAVAAAPIWRATSPAKRAACLERAANMLEGRMPALLGLIVREAGKSLPNAISEVREATDFLHYYAAQIAEFSSDTHRPLGPVACISPWNFPLAIFMGQVSAALAAGNPVLAKPAEETPLIAAQAVRLLHEAGIPTDVVQLLPGNGEVGAALVADPRVCGVVFTGSTEVARLIQAKLAERLNAQGRPIPLIAETGGQNAMIVESSALPEQVVADVLVSAFDSAGQRCSALRVLCLQEDIAERVLDMLKGAMAELAIGNPDRLDVDVGPVITAEARDGILRHVAAMRAKGRVVHTLDLPEPCRHGTFVAPTLIEIERIAELDREVFGPVLHVLRYRRTERDRLVQDINQTGYGLTFGVHTRIDETVARLTQQVRAGNIYVNRNIIGAVVGVQPFGGHGLSGTGPKAGGPLYLLRLLAESPRGVVAIPVLRQPTASARTYLDWLRATGQAAAAEYCARCIETSRLGATLELPGPVGERNLYTLEPRGTVLCVPQTAFGLQAQIAATLATGNRAAVYAPQDFAATLLAAMPQALRNEVMQVDDPTALPCAVALVEGDSDGLRDLNRELAGMDGPIIPVFGVGSDALVAGTEDFPLVWFLRETSISINTAAAGGNASLMTIG
jgi:RHH-type transcriptional regulator, proline utilization regulon repressor / proline dehydrogenase / delta 1-pyrroline-5-carboxylate dehydrogenase